MMRSIVHCVRWMFLVAVVSQGMACATTGTDGGPGAVSRSAAESYREGMVELSRGNYSEAIHLFQEVARSPRYVRWSALAKLRIGDGLFFQEKYAEAVAQYEAFLAQFRGDANTPHARYMLALAHVRQVAEDWWFSPAPHERDRAPLRNARRELETFVSHHSRSPYFPDAVEKLEWVIDLQFAFSAYVAGYYEDRNEPQAVIGRLEHALKVFPRRANRPDTYLRLGRAYAAVAELDRGRDMLRKAKDTSSTAANDEGMQEALQDLETRLHAAEELKAPGVETPDAGADE